MKATEVPPAGMTTVAGTVSSEVSLLAKTTVTSVSTVCDTRTVPALASTPPFSVTLAGSSNVNVAVSLSWTSRLHNSVVVPQTTVSWTVGEPLRRVSSTAVMLKDTTCWPAATGTVAGRLRRAGCDAVTVRLVAAVAACGRHNQTVPVSPSIRRVGV